MLSRRLQNWHQMKPDFGRFEPIFENAHGYLALLHLGGADARQRVADVKACCNADPDPLPDIRLLLAEANWRPHLVAAMAVWFSGYHSETVELLWRRVDRGSWVTPQICATLSVIDPDFPDNARSRLEAGCPLDTSELLAMTAMERHSAAGPAGSVHRSAKTANSLIHLVRMRAPTEKWIAELENSSDLQKLIAEDFDHADAIAEHWLNRVKDLKESLRD